MVAKDPSEYFATRVHDATNNYVSRDHESLIRTIVLRAEVDLVSIEAMFPRMYVTVCRRGIGPSKVLLLTYNIS